MTENEKLPKPMSSTERREIRRIMEKDFGLLRTEVRSQAETVKKQMRDQVRESFNPLVKEAEKAVAKLRKEAEKIEERMQTMVDEYQAKGIKPKSNMKVKVEMSREWTPTGLNEALGNVDELVRAQLAEALHEIDRQEVDFDKQLSLNAIRSAEAQEFVAQIPSAATLFSLDKARVAVAIESGKKQAKAS